MERSLRGPFLLGGVQVCHHRSQHAQATEHHHEPHGHISWVFISCCQLVLHNRKTGLHAMPIVCEYASLKILDVHLNGIKLSSQNFNVYPRHYSSSSSPDHKSITSSKSASTRKLSCIADCPT